MGDVSNFLTFRLPLTAYRFAGLKAPAARSRPLRGVQGAFGAFKVQEGESGKRDVSNFLTYRFPFPLGSGEILGTLLIH